MKNEDSQKSTALFAAVLASISLCSCAAQVTETSEQPTPESTIDDSAEESLVSEDSYSVESSEIPVEESSEQESTDSESHWILKHYVDEFGDETNVAYINYVDFGTFSNSATTNSDLIFSLLVESDSADIKLLEYGSMLVKNSYSRSKSYDVTIKTDDGIKHQLTGTMYSSSDRISFDSMLVFYLKNSKTVDFYIVESDSPTTTYRFSVDTTGLSKKLKKI